MFNHSPMNQSKIDDFNNFINQPKVQRILKTDGHVFNYQLGYEALNQFNKTPEHLGDPFYTKITVFGDYIYIPTYLMGVCDENREGSNQCRTGEIICRNTREDIMYAVDSHGLFDFCGSALIKIYEDQGGQFWAWYCEAMANYDESDVNADKVEEEAEKVEHYLYENQDKSYKNYTKVMKLLMIGMDGYLNDNKPLMGEKMAEVMAIITQKPKKKRVKRKSRR